MFLKKDAQTESHWTCQFVYGVFGKKKYRLVLIITTSEKTGTHVSVFSLFLLR